MKYINNVDITLITLFSIARIQKKYEMRFPLLNYIQFLLSVWLIFCIQLTSDKREKLPSYTERLAEFAADDDNTIKSKS